MIPRVRNIGVLAVLAFLLPCQSVLADAVADARAQHAVHLIRAAKLLMSEQQPTQATIELATLLARDAVDLDDGNVQSWRVLYQLADLSEDMRLRNTAVRRIVELDPDDQVARLRLAMANIERLHTVEDRVREYERLLHPDRRQRLGAAVASNLALDLALLQRRRGNSEQFAHWLAEAVALDSSNRAAVAMATGYFRMNVSDAFGEAELLVALLMADPMNVTSQVTLAGHLLEHGVYEAASRIYNLTAETYKAGRAPVPEHLIADMAIARWGAGDTEGVRRLIRERQRLADTILRRRLIQEHPDMTSLERARETGVIDTTLALTRAALHRSLDTDQVDAAIDQCVRAYEHAIAQALENEEPDHQAVARLKLELAWALLWLDADRLQRVEDLVAEAEAYGELSDRAEARFAGWQALRSGQAKDALQLLSEHVDDDATAALGVALAQIELGQQRDAARSLVNLARQYPGTLIGVWSRDLLWEVLGQRASLATEQARRMQQLVDAIPSIVDRFAADPTTAVSLRITPARSTFEPYDPVVVNLEITNHAPFPIAISRDGPIRPQVALIVSTEMVRVGRMGQLPPMVVDIDQRLRLMPRERVVVPFDLRTSRMGLLLDAAPVPGAIVRVRGILNFIVSPQGAILPGVLGSERESNRFRVDGFRLTQQWIEDAIASLMESNDELNVSHLGALMNIAANPVDIDPGQRRLFDDARQVLVETYAGLDPMIQAWLLASMTRRGAINAILEQAKESNDHHVQVAYMLFHAQDRNDPIVAAARRSDNGRLKRIAELVEPRLLQDDDPFSDLVPMR